MKRLFEERLTFAVCELQMHSPRWSGKQLLKRRILLGNLQQNISLLVHDVVNIALCEAKLGL